MAGALLAVETIALLLLVYACSAQAHSWYPARCCSDRDCTPLGPGDVLETDQAYLFPRLSAVWPKSIKPDVSHDDRWHICIGPTGTPICLFKPELMS